MMLKRPCCLILHAQCQPIAVRRPHTSPEKNAGTRDYATIADAKPEDLDDYIWPRSTVSKLNPTPYEILQIKRNAPYTKHCYYRLVKIYHPDRDNHISSSASTVSSLPQNIRIERYRLVVAAHEILSDPVKRKAYDTYGKGWAHRHDPHPWHHYPHKSKSERSQNHWTGFDSPFANATWEDWERWYERQHGKQPPQEPVYISNVGFVLAVTGAVVVGAVGQSMNVGNHEQFFKEQADKSHEKAASYFRERVLMGTENAADRPQQIKRFLKQREQSGYTVPAEFVEERKALPPPPSSGEMDGGERKGTQNG